MKLSLYHRIIYSIFPRNCVHCGAYDNDYICTYCSQSLIQYSPECYITRRQSNNWECISPHKSDYGLEKVCYFYRYTTIIHSLMHAIKYSHHYDSITKIVDLILQANEFKNITFDGIDYITFVPVTRKRLFNHSYLIARALSKFLQIELIRLLIKTKDTIAQAKLNRKDRIKNLRDCFTVRYYSIQNLYNKNILIVDDICTTGTTLQRCAQAIKKHSPTSKIYGLCLARG